MDMSSHSGLDAGQTEAGVGLDTHERVALDDRGDLGLGRSWRPPESAFRKGNDSRIPVALQDRSKRPDAAAAAQTWPSESGAVRRLQPTRRKSAGDVDD
jgi:hypothetical protein